MEPRDVLQLASADALALEETADDGTRDGAGETRTTSRRERRAAPCALRRAPSRATRARCPGTKALLLPRCVLPISSPAVIIGTPCESSERDDEVPLLAQRGARGSSGRSVSPSTPQFHEALSSLPSRFSSPFASLCFFSYDDEIAQREAVVRGDEVDARVRMTAVVLVEIARAGEAIAEIGDRSTSRRSRTGGRCRDSGRSTPSRAPGNFRPDSRRRRDPTARR